jgi:squalene-associated FAD-dependent desaturase
VAGLEDVVAELNVGIIGGGYAGMAAATALAQHGIPVTVYESARQLGGRARGVDGHGLRLDNGQHILLGCYRDTLRLIALAGGDPDRDFLHLPLQLTLHNRFELKAPALPAPLHLLAGLMTARGLTLIQRLTAARFMLALRRIHFRLPRDITALGLLREHGQDQELVRLLWEPICISALNTPLHKASAQVLLNVLRDSLNGSRTDAEILLPRIDFSALFPERAATYIGQHGGNVLTACAAQAIVPQGAAFELHTSQGIYRHSHVVCAASAVNAARLLRGIPQLVPIAAQIDALSFQPIYTVYLQYPPAVRLPQAMLGFDHGISQWLFDRGRIAGQHGLIALVISAEGRHQELPHEHLAQRVAQELCAHLGIAEVPLWHQVIAEKRATFSCEPGLNRPAAATPVAKLLLAGDYVAGDYPATLEGAVRSGLHCAAMVMAEQNAAAQK